MFEESWKLIEQNECKVIGLNMLGTKVECIRKKLEKIIEKTEEDRESQYYLCESSFTLVGISIIEKGIE